MSTSGESYQVRPFLKIRRKSIEELTQEIRAGQRPDPGAERRYRAALAFMSLPRPLRSLAWRAGMSNPTWFKRLGGTVGLSSVGMFGPGGGWGIPIAPPTLMITVGGIATKPRYVDGNLEPRELLDVTISVDHAVVDGATAARLPDALPDCWRALYTSQTPRLQIVLPRSHRMQSDLPTALAVDLCRVFRNQSIQEVLREPLYLVPVGVLMIT
jgi:hypothetical protein